MTRNGVIVGDKIGECFPDMDSTDKIKFEADQNQPQEDPSDIKKMEQVQKTNYPKRIRSKNKGNPTTDSNRVIIGGHCCLQGFCANKCNRGGALCPCYIFYEKVCRKDSGARAGLANLT
ncbi:hypothetical protein J6590_053327 [Homalodisca vitripennis]|nr:hypothetical protein J6590_053327 [Homalodisca vitripennis]